MKKISLVFVLFLFIGCSEKEDGQEKIRIQVQSGDLNRVKSIVSVDSLSLKAGVNYVLQDTEERIIPAQRNGDVIAFSINGLPANDSILFELIESDSFKEKSTKINFKEDAVELSNSSGSPGFQYRTGVGGLDQNIVDEVFYRGGYLHPLFTPNGRSITEHYTENRPHQNGIWTGWFKTEWNGLKPDFWSQAEQTGKVEVVTINRIETGPVYGELETTHHFNEKITGNNSTIISDAWKVRYYNNLEINGRPINVIDLNVVQTNISEHPFRLIEHVYGGIGFRGSDDWLGEGKMDFITSEGESRAEAHKSKAKWVGMSGQIDGKKASIIILAHSDNVRFPEPVFINQREPFFTFAPLQEGDLILYPSEHFKAKYRYIIMDGNLPSTEIIENYWRDYTNPMTTQIIIQ